MALTKEKRNLLFAMGALLAVIALFQMISYGHVVGMTAARRDPVRVIKQRFEKRFPQVKACVSHLCVYFDITLDSKPAGRVVFLLYEKKAPKAVENFRSLATGQRGVSKKGTRLHYKGTSFHRVVHNMLVQGGDILRGKGVEGEIESIYGGGFEHERRNDTFNKKGLLAMASIGPDQNGSQFFVTVDIVAELNGVYVVFGEVVDGMVVMDRINNVTLTEDEAPTVPVIISDCGQL